MFYSRILSSHNLIPKPSAILVTLVFGGTRPMGGIKRKKCFHCRQLFPPDPRNAKRQRYCCKPGCRKASKVSSQRRWLQKEENRDYFSGPENVQRVQQWRKANPGYWRRKTKIKPDALQDPLNQQLPENNDNSAEFASDALQDSLILQPAVLIGLIAQLTGFALQDDIALAVRRMQQLGQDILNPQPNKGGSHGTKASHLSRSYPQSPQTVQLAGSASGP